ncbi:uncharacterized protein A4U43_C08F5530 [Asparagus officinalis]|nr:uncharacterized protein A4U43_C08F5530 [Asparagus officinalis]
MREKGKKDYEKPDRHESAEKTKVSSKVYHAIFEWKDNIPIGDWAVRFNNLIGCLIRDSCSNNIAHNFEKQEFKGIKKIWEKLMDHYYIEDNPESWDYVIPRMTKLIRGWKSDLAAPDIWLSKLLAKHCKPLANDHLARPPLACDHAVALAAKRRWPNRGLMASHNNAARPAAAQRAALSNPKR